MTKKNTQICRGKISFLFLENCIVFVLEEVNVCRCLWVNILILVLMCSRLSEQFHNSRLMVICVGLLGFVAALMRHLSVPSTGIAVNWLFRSKTSQLGLMTQAYYHCCSGGWDQKVRKVKARMDNLAHVSNFGSHNMYEAKKRGGKKAYKLWIYSFMHFPPSSFLGHTLMTY